MKYKSKFKKRKTYYERMHDLHFKKKSIYDGQRIIKRKDKEKMKYIELLQDQIRQEGYYYRPFRNK